MAFSYPNTPVLSKVQIGGKTYYLKDADARAILDAALATWGENPDLTKLTTAGAVKEYVDSQIETIPEFDVVVVQGDLPTASANTFHKIYLQAASSPAKPNLYKEWITIRSGAGTELSPYTYSWELIGDTAMDLTTYLQDTATVAGVAFGEDKAITVAEMSTALDLKALAHKDSASTTLNDYATGIQAATYTPAGSVTVQLSQTSTAASLTKGDFTPAGTVEVTADTAAAATYSKVSGITLEASDVPQGGTATYTPAGSVEVTNVTVTPATASYNVMSTAGTAYSITKGSVAHANDTTASFTTNGIVASVGTGTDAETLIFTSAATSDAVTSVGQITYTAPVLTGALPTFKEVAVATGITSATATAAFTGTGTILSASASFEAVAATMTQPTFTAAFTGSTAENVLVTGVDYDKATLSSATFTGTQDSIAPTLTTGTKDITVS